ncbi:MAG: Fe-S cluster assembly protein SufB, partial [Planctomycetaceae bacterium]
MATDLQELKAPKTDLGIGEYKYGFHDPTDKYPFRGKKGIDADVVRAISEMKNEPQWMRDFRLEALDIFFEKPMPTWGGDLSHLDFQDIFYYVRASDKQE